MSDTPKKPIPVAIQRTQIHCPGCKKTTVIEWARNPGHGWREIFFRYYVGCAIAHDGVIKGIQYFKRTPRLFGRIQ